MKQTFTISDLSFSFQKNQKPLFDHLSAVFSNEQLAFIRGKNGSGKSTLFRLIQGTHYSDELLEGHIAFDDTKYDLKKDEEVLGNVIRLAHQDYDKMLALDFTFKENVQFASMNRFPSFVPLPQISNYPS